MKLKYKRIELKSDKDFKQAEALRKKGYKVILIGIDYILLEKQRRASCTV